MPNPFRFFPLESFPTTIQTQDYTVPRQLKMGQTDAEDTVLTWRERIPGPRTLDRLEIRHDVVVHSAGRVPVEIRDGEYRVESFSEYITTHHLEAYLSADKKLIAIEGKGFVVQDAVRTLRDHANEIRIATNRVDFEKLLPRLEQVRGVWFSKTGGPVSAMGLFGHAVAESPEWAGARPTSEIRTLMVQHLYGEEFQSIMITRDAGVVVYQNLPAEKLLTLVFDVYEGLLVPALEPPDFSKNRGAPRS